MRAPNVAGVDVKERSGALKVGAHDRAVIYREARTAGSEGIDGVTVDGRMDGTKTNQIIK